MDNAAGTLNNLINVIITEANAQKTKSTTPGTTNPAPGTTSSTSDTIHNQTCFALYSEYAATQNEIDIKAKSFETKLADIKTYMDTNKITSNAATITGINTQIDTLLNNFQIVLNAVEKTQNTWNEQYKTTLGTMNSMVNTLDNIQKNLNPNTYFNISTQ
jgi:uncharacterized protein YukE